MIISATIVAAGVACLALFTGSGGTETAPARRDTIPVDSTAAIKAPPPDVRSYVDLLSDIESIRHLLSTDYRRASTASLRSAIVAQARDSIEHYIYTALFPYWYGTPWDFNGITEIPGSGSIACGYFVTTVLRDAGWVLERSRLAQQPSENIIKSLVFRDNIKRFSNIPLTDFVAAVREWGPGLYVTGLDIHTGFIMNTGDDVYFIHASYVAPRTVIKERAVESKILAASRYRVLGSISADERLIIKWLTREKVITKM